MNYPKIWCKQPKWEGVQQELQFAAGLIQMSEKTGFQGPIECLSKKQLDKLTKKSTKVKQPKLLGSKSLSQLVPRGLFFKKSSNGNNETNKTKNLTSTKSFPSQSYQSTSSGSSSSVMSSGQATFISRVNSASMIGLPRQSSSSTFAVRSNNSTMEQPNLSPIVMGGSQQQEHQQHQQPTSSDENGNEMIDMSWTETGPTGGGGGEQSNNHQVSEVCGQSREGEDNDKTSKRKADNNDAVGGGGKYRPLLVLRDVKNSLGLRMKAKHECQAFTKLVEQAATPPTKLYSPFNIYTDSCSKDLKNNKCSVTNSNSRRHLQTPDDFTTPNNKGNQQDTATVKGRIAFQHKKHLMQANKFTFDSPTGRLRETVKDVEHFQQCIEDISKAIKARDSL